MSQKKKTQAHKHTKPTQHAAESWQGKGWKQYLQRTSPPPTAPALARARFTDDDSDILRDILPLITTKGKGGDSTIGLTEELLYSLVDNAHLADEPEFQDLFFQPMDCIETWAKVATEKGIDPESLLKMSEDERADKQAELMAECTQRLLTNEMAQDIVKRLTALRLRLKQSGKQAEAARVAALKSFLGMRAGESILASTGLVQAIFGRSLEAGFELARSVAEVGAGNLDDETQWLEKPNGSPLARAAEALLNKIPGLRGYLENQADKVWDEGQDALFGGHLCLGIYSDEEKKRALILITDAMGYDMSPGNPHEARAPKKLPKDGKKRAMEWLHKYITEILTPERLKQLRERMAVLEKDPSYDRKWLPFLVMMRGDMQEKDAVKNEIPFLTNVLMGELRLWAAGRG